MNYGNKTWFFAKSFVHFQKWTKKMSKNENPKILLEFKINLI